MARFGDLGQRMVEWLHPSVGEGSVDLVHVVNKIAAMEGFPKFSGVICWRNWVSPILSACLKVARGRHTFSPWRPGWWAMANSVSATGEETWNMNPAAAD